MNLRRSLALLVALAPVAARASPGDTYGVLPRGVATAGAQTAAADDAGAAYYNPAGLALAGADGRTKVVIGYAAGLPFASIDRKKPEAQSDFRTKVPEGQGWTTIGIVFPFRGIVNNRASLGVVAYLPQDKLVRVNSVEPRDPQWLRYESATDRMLLELGLGVKLHPKVALGIGLDVFAGLEGTVDFDIELFEKRVDRRDLDFALKNSVALVAGLTFTPVDPLRFGFSYRMSNQLNISQPNKLALGDIGTLLLDVSGVVHYTPDTFALGVTWLPNESVKLSADVRAELWQNAPFPATQVRVKLTGEIPEQLGLDEALAFRTTDPPTGFKPTIAPSLAFEYRFPDGVTYLRGGYSLRPTYVPDQVRATSNFLDNTAHLVGAGLTFQLTDPTGVFSQAIKLDLGAQGQLFQPRSVKKVQGNDAVGDYDFGGFAVAFAGAARYEF